MTLDNNLEVALQDKSCNAVMMCVMYTCGGTSYKGQTSNPSLAWKIWTV